MNEQDTFNALKRVSINEMKKLYNEWLSANFRDIDIDDSDFYKTHEDFFNKHGWTWDEYFKARESNNARRRNI